MSLIDPAEFAALFCASYAAHLVTDHAGQPSAWAKAKGLPGRTGRRACTQHTAVVVAGQAAAVTGTALATGMTLTPVAVALGLALTGWSHYWADRRTTLAGLWQALNKAEFAGLGTPRPGRDDNPSLGTGAYRLDQDWHITWLVITCLTMAAHGWSLALLTGLAITVMTAAILGSHHGRRASVRP